MFWIHEREISNVKSVYKQFFFPCNVYWNKLLDYNLLLWKQILFQNDNYYFEECESDLIKKLLYNLNAKGNCLFNIKEIALPYYDAVVYVRSTYEHNNHRLVHNSYPYCPEGGYGVAVNEVITEHFKLYYAPVIIWRLS